VIEVDPQELPVADRRQTLRRDLDSAVVAVCVK
jgi:hypothetical protein